MARKRVYGLCVACDSRTTGTCWECGVSLHPAEGTIMIFIGSLDGVAVLMLTEQDVNDMRGGRTKFADLQKPAYRKVVLSVHKNQKEIEDIIKQAGHGKLLQGLPSPVAEPDQKECTGCKAFVSEPLLLEGKCIVCWRESAKAKGEV